MTLRVTVSGVGRLAARLDRLADQVELAVQSAVAAGADGLMIEVHPEPDHALSDGAQSLTPKNFAKLVERTRTLAQALGRDLASTGATTEKARKAS